MGLITISRNVPVPMRDGLRIAADLYRCGEGPSPVLMARTPYDKDGIILGRASAGFDVLRAVEAGYVVVVQDVRGRYAAEGSFGAQEQETADGVDAIAWAASQPWSSGVVGMFGGSYLGCTQWLPAREAPEALRALAPSVTLSDMYEGMCFQGGVPVSHGILWAVGLSANEAQRRTSRGEAVPDGVADLDALTELGRMPLNHHPVLDELNPFLPGRLSHTVPSAYWEEISPNAGYEAITAPALGISGWYDVFLQGTLDNFTGMRTHGATEQIRRAQKVVIGPWTHGNFSGSFPEHEFGPGASSDAIDLAGMQLRWFDRWLTGTENGIDDEDPVTIFVMGLNQWRTEKDWPLPDTRYTDYHLHSGGSANTRHGDGALSLDAPGDEPADTFLADPHRPVPTVGGQVILPGANSGGPRDQAGVEDRDDVLVYSTPVLDRPIEVTGPVSLTMHLSSTAPDADVTAKLVDVHPDGRAIILTDGIMRARYRHGYDAPALLEPGAPAEVTVDLWATSNVFLPGHHIRLEVSASNFPRFARNSHTGGDIGEETAAEHVPAINRIHHDTAHPTRLTLPIIER